MYFASSLPQRACVLELVYVTRSKWRCGDPPCLFTTPENCWPFLLFLLELYQERRKRTASESTGVRLLIWVGPNSNWVRLMKWSASEQGLRKPVNILISFWQVICVLTNHNQVLLSCMLPMTHTWWRYTEIVTAGRLFFSSRLLAIMPSKLNAVFPCLKKEVKSTEKRSIADNIFTWIIVRTYRFKPCYFPFNVNWVFLSVSLFCITYSFTV